MIGRTLTGISSPASWNDSLPMTVGIQERGAGSSDSKPCLGNVLLRTALGALIALY
jgi:hypothetical protein